MLQFSRTNTLRYPASAGVLIVCCLLSGCATFTDTSLQDPFRSAVEPVRQHRVLTSPFAWKESGSTSKGEPLQTAAAGTDGFRTLVVGSAGGDDPAALQLTEDLARYVHENQLIMGGFRTTILRTMNPDGLKLGQHENAAGLYLNDHFPKKGQTLSLAELRRLPREVQFVTGHVIEQRPQRIIHIRSIRDARGMVAVSSGAADSGREFAEWLGFETRRLPEDVSSGTLESWAAHRGDCDVITVGIPETTRPQEAWALYGDAVLSLLLDGDSESRRVARERKQQRSANRRSPWSDDSRRMIDDMFREDLPEAFDSASAAESTELK